MSDVTRLDERRRRRAPTSIAGTLETELERHIEGDHVVLRCLRRRPDDHEQAGIEIVRLDDHGRIVERWGVPVGCSDLDVEGDRIIRLLLAPSSCTVPAPWATTTR